MLKIGQSQRIKKNPEGNQGPNWGVELHKMKINKYATYVGILIVNFSNHFHICKLLFWINKVK